MKCLKCGEKIYALAYSKELGMSVCAPCVFKAQQEAERLEDE